MKQIHSSKKVLIGGVIAVAALLLAGCSAAAPAPKSSDKSAGPVVPVNVALGYLKDVTYAGNWIADDSGLYAKDGLAPTFLQGGPNAPAPEVTMAGGQATIGYENNTTRLFSYLAKTQDIVIIGVRYAKTPNGFVSLAKRPVTKPSELKGARVIAGAPNRPNMDALMSLNNVKDYKFVVGGTDVGPLLAGDGDALLTTATGAPLQLEQQGMKEGKDFFFTPFSDLNFHVLSNIVIVSKSYLESNREQVVNFMAATIQGWQQQIKDPAKGAKLTVEKYGADLGLDLANQTASAKADIPYMKSALTESQGIFRIDPKDVTDNVYPGLEKAGITGLPDASTIIDTTVLDDVYKKISK